MVTANDNGIHKRTFISINTLEKIMRDEECHKYDHTKDYMERILVSAKTTPTRKKPEPPPPGGITLRQAEDKYGISNVTLSRWVKNGIIEPLKKTAGKIYVDNERVKELINRYNQEPGRGKRTIYKID